MVKKEKSPKEKNKGSEGIAAEKEVHKTGKKDDTVEKLEKEHKNLIEAKSNALSMRLDELSKNKKIEIDEIKSQISIYEKEITKIEEKFAQKEASVVKEVDDDHDPQIKKISSELEIKQKNLDEAIAKEEELTVKKKELIDSIKNLKKTQKLATSLAEKSKVLSTQLKSLPEKEESLDEKTIPKIGIDNEFETQIKDIDAKLSSEEQSLEAIIKKIDDWTAKKNELKDIVKNLKREHGILEKAKSKILNPRLDELSKNKKNEINEIRKNISANEKEITKVEQNFAKKEASLAKEVDNEFDPQIAKTLSKLQKKLEETIKTVDVTPVKKEVIEPKSQMEVKPKKEIAPEELRICPACGRDTRISHKFCKFCGISFSRIDAVMTKLSEAEKKELESVLKKEKKERICPACGRKIKIDIKFCKFCGIEISRIEAILSKATKSETKELESVPKKDLKPKKVVAPKKQKAGVIAAADTAALSEAEKKELEKTESEMDISKKKVECIVHRGPIVGSIYLCPSCMTYYCIKCAKALKEKDEACWSCGEKIDIAVSETEIKQRIKDYETRLDSLKITVKNLDESFFTGAISKEEYIKMKDSLTEKIGVLLREIKNYKS